MKKVLILISSAFILACETQPNNNNNTSNNNNNSSLEKENELLKKELELEKRENSISNKENSLSNNSNSSNNNTSSTTNNSNGGYNVTQNVETNVIHCQNGKFIIRIDRMKNGDLRYTSWNKPKTEKDAPALQLFNGDVEKQGTMGGYIYTFKSGEWVYIIEDNQMGESDASMGRFLKLLQNGKQILYTKMKDIR